jgi:hypothetical protein
MPALLQITLPYACAGIETDGLDPCSRCTYAAPIFKWMIGKLLWEIKAWVTKKNGSIKIAVEF